MIHDLEPPSKNVSAGVFVVYGKWQWIKSGILEMSEE